MYYCNKQEIWECKNKCDNCDKLHSRKRFCSTDCKIEFHKNAKLRRIKQKADLCPRKCGYCPEFFVPNWNTNHDRQKFCSNNCKKEFHKEAERTRRKEIRQNTIKTCPICDKEFTPKKTLKEIYCSPRCRNCIGRKVYKMMSSCYESANTKKSGHSHKVLGYSPNELLKHLQSFPQWNKLKTGTWHLDHIFPIIAFTRSGIRDISLMCRLDNLQPLLGQVNCKKNDTYNNNEFKEWLNSVK